MSSPRPDTRYLGTDPPAITTDAGQRLTNLVIAAPGGYELASARTALDGDGDGRSIELEVDLDNVTSGTLVDHGSFGIAGAFKIQSAVGVLRFTDTTNAIVIQLTPPSLAAGARPYIVAWNTEPNADTTGAADALRSVAMVYDVTGGRLVWDVAAHAVPAVDATAAFAVAGEYNAGLVNTYAPGIEGVRISARFHTRVEVREHWVAQTAAPTIGGITAVEPQPIPADACLALSGAGPQYQTAYRAMQVDANRERLVSPVVQWITSLPVVWGEDLATTTDAPRVFAMDGGYQTHLGWLWRRKIPRTCSFITIRIQWATWRDDANPIDEVELRAHTATESPLYAAEFASTSITRQTDDGVSGLGVLESFADLFVERDDDGWTWIWLASRMDGGAGSANTFFTLREVTISPLSKGSIDDIPPNQWGP